ncbi:MAG: rhodanese-like domain-containing protein [Methyloligellaceae bacterium]
MAQNIKVGCRDLVEAAQQLIDEVTIEEVQDNRDDIVLVDIRDVRELKRDGKIPDAFHCPRGMLEFWIDPASPYHKDIFQQDKKFVFYCASGWRSVLATEVAQRMGLSPVANMIGGFGGWRDAGGSIEKKE